MTFQTFKQTVLSIAILFMASVSIHAQQKPSMQALMGQSLAKLQQQPTPQAMLNCVAEMKRIETMFPDSIQPKYQMTLQSLSYSVSNPQAPQTEGLLEEAGRVIEKMEQITGKKMLDAHQMNYRYETFDYKSYAQRRYRMDPERRDLNTDHAVDYDKEILISKDTAFIDEDGNIQRSTIVRPLTSAFDFVNTYIVNIYPDTTVWVNDFANAFTDQYARYYFSSPIYDDYPVVGVSWEQATAYCAWRTEYLKQSYGMRGIDVEPFRLPTEAEWEYAARAGNNDQTYSWKTDMPRTEKGCYDGNFKPGDGDYSRDGYIITAPVGSYASNDFGLYDMSGNVAEWTSTAWSEAGVLATSDINPDYQYNAAKEDPYRLKRKVIRGGSWKDQKYFIQVQTRTYEFQDTSKSYIGFRCVQPYLGRVKGDNLKTATNIVK